MQNFGNRSFASLSLIKDENHIHYKYTVGKQVSQFIIFFLEFVEEQMDILLNILTHFARFAYSYPAKFVFTSQQGSFANENGVPHIRLRMIVPFIKRIKPFCQVYF